MSKENIINNILKIPSSKLENLPSDEEYLQGEEGSVRYVITKGIEETNKQTASH